MNVDNIDIRGRLLAQIAFSELEKIARSGRFILNNMDDLLKSRQQLKDATKRWAAESGSTKKRLGKELDEMQRDLNLAEKDLRRRATDTTVRSMNPAEYARNARNEPEIGKVTELVKEINKNRTRKPGLLFKRRVNTNPPKNIIDEAAVKNRQAEMRAAESQKGGFGEFAKKVGYGTMAAGALYGGHKLYQAKQERDQMAQFGGGGMY